MIAPLIPRKGADGGWCRRRSSKPFRGAQRVPGGFDSHTFPWPSSRRVAIALTAAWLVCLAGLAAPERLAAQDDPPPAVPPAADSAAADSAAIAADSAIAVDSTVSLVIVRPAPGQTAASERSGPSPMSAFFRSVLIPGWGQLAADQPVRAAFYFVAQSATVFMVIRTQKRIDDATSEGLKESRRDQREDWLVLAGFWALASGIDAWVSAHMWGFEGEVVPPPDGAPGVAVQYRVPVPGF